MIFAAILAGGSGLRMKQNMPKQLLLLSGKPVFIRTLEAFLAFPEFEALYLAMNRDCLEEAERMIGEYLPEEKERICLLAGGENRNASLKKVVEALTGEYGERADQWLVSHDGVRPLVSREIIRANIDALNTREAVGTAIACSDTLFRSEDGARIDSIPDRSLFFRAQTPQSFRLPLLRELLSSLTPEETSRMTDACSLCLARGIPVYMVEGSPENLKLTTPEDMALAEALLKLR